MHNNSKIHFDGKCIYINSEVRIALWVKLILILINIMLWTGFIFLLISIKANEVKSFILPFVLITTFLVFVARFTTWNLWGEEFIIINTKVLTHYKSFGIIQTNKTVIKINNTMGYAYSKVKFEDGAELGDIYFYEYDENNNPLLIYETNVLMTKETAEDVINKIENLFELAFFEKEKIIPFTLN